MNRNAGLALAFALAVTAAVHSPLHQGAAPDTQVVQPVEPPVRVLPGPAAKGPVYAGGCTAYDVASDKPPRDANQGAAKAFVDRFFALEPKKPTAPSLSKLNGLRYAIALVADPRHTNLSLIFDRQMAVIQQAAQDEQYTYDSSWMPWQTEHSSYPLLKDQQDQDDLTDHREACPGILLFRRSEQAGAPSGQDYSQALVVLVVGEQPTGGLNENQWANAIQWLTFNASPKEFIGGTTGPARILRILGPSFSGSLAPLARDLTRLFPIKPPPSATFTEARVLSGSVSDCASVRRFQQLQWPTLPEERPAVAFGTFLENDDRQVWSFLGYLESQSDTAPDRGTARDTVILSEDETAYSGGAPTTVEGATDSACTFPYAPEHRPVRLFFPRDISALRHAYEKESIFTTSSSGAGDHAVHTVLQEGGEQVDNGGNPSDTIQAYSGQLTPIAQEAVLYGIVSYLRAHHTRYLVLRCTNPLDFLFLTRFFHRAYPEGRIVTVGSDLLFRREVDTTEFRGVLSLSNFPLLPRNQHWSILSEAPGPMPGHAHRVFETHSVEGTYIAARYLFSDTHYLAPQPGQDGDTFLRLPLKESLPEYADPFWLHAPGEAIKDPHAPTWLTVVGREGYWPIAVLNDVSTPTMQLDKNHLDPVDTPGKQPPPSTMVRLTSIGGAHYDLESPDRNHPGGPPHFNPSLRPNLPMAWTICSLLACLLLVYQVFGVWRGHRYAATGLFSVFRKLAASRPGAIQPRTAAQEILLGINSAIAAMLLVLQLSIGLTMARDDLFSVSDPAFSVFLWLAAVLILTMAVGLFKRSLLAGLCFLAMFTPTLVLVFATLSSMLGDGSPAHQANRIPLFYRMGHLTSGVAPLLPVLFLFAGFYFWTWQAMAGSVLLADGRPTLPKLAGVPAVTGRFRVWYRRLRGLPVDATGNGNGWDRLKDSELRLSQDMANRIVAVASPLSVPPAVILLPTLLAGGAYICFHKDLPLLSMEGYTFALRINICLLAAFLLVSADAARLFWSWNQLRRLLSKLNRLRLRRTFARLRVIDASSLWGMSGGVQRVQYHFFSQQLEAARRLNAFVPPHTWLAMQEVVDFGTAFDKNSAHHLSDGPQWNQEFGRLRDREMVNIRDVFSDGVAATLALLLPWWAEEKGSLALAEDGPSSGDEQGAVSNLPLPKDLSVRAAEEFVCFHYIAFIQNTLARMRTMALSMILLFLAVSLAISFYPFVPRTQIGMWMMVNLVVIGAAVVYVYAGMERDAILSYITNTRPGRLGGEFWLKTAAFLAGPVIGILTTQFPAVADSVLGWVQPGLDAIGR